MYKKYLWIVALAFSFVFSQATFANSWGCGEGIKTMLSADPYVYACFTSVSGTGLCVLFKIDPDRHLDAFNAIADYLIKKYQIIIDPSGKDVSRPRYVSWDPYIHINPYHEKAC